MVAGGCFPVEVGGGLLLPAQQPGPRPLVGGSGQQGGQQGRQQQGGMGDLLGGPLGDLLGGLLGGGRRA